MTKTDKMTNFDNPTALQLDQVIGIFGGGQLGRLLSQAAKQFGYRVHIFDTQADTPAGRISDCSTTSPYDDMAAIEKFALACDVITYEFENIPPATIKAVTKHTPVYPSAHALEISHDRVIEKTFLRDQAGVPVIEFYPVETVADLTTAMEKFGGPAVLKTRRFGYDGKGQIKVDTPADAQFCFDHLGGADLIAEKFAPFVREVSIIAARGQDGKIAAYPLTQNVHKDHRLHTSIAPAPDPQNIKEAASKIAHQILTAVDYVGVMGIEFFEMGTGTLIVNEIAPRVHNSGHWTQDGGCTDQFENHIRAVAGLPLGRTTPMHTVMMTNLIGDEIKDAKSIAERPNTFVHDYGKRDIRDGRKMGHFNTIILDEE